MAGLRLPCAANGCQSHRQLPSLRYSSSASTCTRANQRRQLRKLARASPPDSAEKSSPESSTSSQDDLMSDEEIRKLAALKRQMANQPGGGSSNLLVGALEEAKLITWPRPQKALSDTVLVLAIVAATGCLLYGVNVALAQLSELWYHRG